MGLYLEEWVLTLRTSLIDEISLSTPGTLFFTPKNKQAKKQGSSIPAANECSMAKMADGRVESSTGTCEIPKAKINHFFCLFAALSLLSLKTLALRLGAALSS